MNLNRWIVVPLTAAVLFAVGYGVAALVGLIWQSMPPAIRWLVPIVLVVWYLIDVWNRSQPQA